MGDLAHLFGIFPVADAEKRRLTEELNSFAQSWTRSCMVSSPPMLMLVWRPAKRKNMAGRTAAASGMVFHQLKWARKRTSRPASSPMKPPRDWVRDSA